MASAMTDDPRQRFLCLPFPDHEACSVDDTESFLGECTAKLRETGPRSPDLLCQALLR